MGENLLYPASPQAHAISTLFLVVLAVSAVILGTVGGLVVYIVLKYRNPDREPSQRDHNTPLEVLWTAIPFGILVLLFVLSVQAMHRSNPPVRATAPDLRIIAHQWWWEVRYPKTGVVTANEIHIPTGTTILAGIESADVIHSFWVPRLNRKVDAIPGHPNHLWLEADDPGLYLGTCAEFCGRDHAYMRIRVVAQKPEEFRDWERAQLALPPPPGGSEAEEGSRLFRDKTCGNCHRIAGTDSDGTAGPDLTHLADRSTLASGVVDNTPLNLARWIAHPDSIKPGSRMPDLHLRWDEAKSLAAYLDREGS